MVSAHPMGMKGLHKTMKKPRLTQAQKNVLDEARRNGKPFFVLGFGEVYQDGWAVNRATFAALLDKGLVKRKGWDFKHKHAVYTVVCEDCGGDCDTILKGLRKALKAQPVA